MKNSMSELFPGCEALMEDVEINNNVTVPTEDAEQIEEAGVVEGETQAAETAEIESDANETEAAATAFARQFGELCNMQAHIETYGVDRTFLALCNRDNILGRAFGIQMPACESFDTVGSPYSPLSIACIEAMGDGMWDTFKKWVQKIWLKIKQFFIRIADWFRDIMGNNNMRYHRYKTWYDKNSGNTNLKFKEKNGKTSDVKLSLPETDKNGVSGERFAELLKSFQEKVLSKNLWSDLMKAINDINDNSTDMLNSGTAPIRPGQTSAITGSGSTYNTNGYQGFGNERSKDEKKEIKKLLEGIDDIKDKIKDKKLMKYTNQELDKWLKSARFNTVEDLMKEYGATLNSAEEALRRIEAFERVKQSFDNAVKMNFDKLNNAIQRETGSSMGAKSRQKLSDNVNTVNKVVFKTGVIPMFFNKFISMEFKYMSALQSCTTSGNLNDE